MNHALREPARLLASAAADSLAQRLLRSAQMDNPSERSLLAAPLGIATRLSSSTLVAATLQDSGTSWLDKAKHPSAKVIQVTRRLATTVAAGGVVAMAVVGLNHSTVRGSISPRPGTLAASVATTVMPVPCSNDPLPTPVMDLPIVSTAASDRAVLPKKAAQDDLVQELEFLDEAKAALAASKPAAALNALSQADRLSRRALVPEATVLRVRALIAAGRFSQARQVAKQFTRNAPNAPQSAVLKDLVASIENQ